LHARLVCANDDCALRSSRECPIIRALAIQTSKGFPNVIPDLRLLLAFSSVLLLLGCGGSTQQKESKWPNGKTREMWLEDGDGFRHGLASTYYENGKLQTQVTFERDYPHGPFKMWDRAGNVIASGEFKNGEKWSGRFIRGDMALGHVDFEEWENGAMTSTPRLPSPPRPPTPPPSTSGTNQAVTIPPEAPVDGALPPPPPLPPAPPAGGPAAPAPPPPPAPAAAGTGAPAPPPPPPPPPAPQK
jgi:hypothetical protein